MTSWESLLFGVYGCKGNRQYQLRKAFPSKEKKKKKNPNAILLIFQISKFDFLDISVVYLNTICFILLVTIINAFFLFWNVCAHIYIYFLYGQYKYVKHGGARCSLLRGGLLSICCILHTFLKRMVWINAISLWLMGFKKKSFLFSKKKNLLNNEK